MSTARHKPGACHGLWCPVSAAVIYRHRVCFLFPTVPVKNSYLTHLSMEGDGSEPEISE